jgi:hypothetical protein
MSTTGAFGDRRPIRLHIGATDDLLMASSVVTVTVPARRVTHDSLRGFKTSTDAG